MNLYWKRIQKYNFLNVYIHIFLLLCMYLQNQLDSIHRILIIVIFLYSYNRSVYCREKWLTQQELNNKFTHGKAVKIRSIYYSLHVSIDENVNNIYQKMTFSAYARNWSNLWFYTFFLQIHKDTCKVSSDLFFKKKKKKKSTCNLMHFLIPDIFKIIILLL